jgi:hypothetical protein
MLEDFAKLIAWIIPVIVLAAIFLPQTIRILREYERGVIFRLGKLLGIKGPGLIFLIPIVDRMVRMDPRVIVDIDHSFRSAFKKRPCLIPGDGFYEWKKFIGGKIPYSIEMKDDSPRLLTGNFSPSPSFDAATINYVISR